jgi:hypothetical protein
MKKDEEVLESLIAGGLIGGALGALLSKDKGNGGTWGALIGAVILATFKASERAKESNVAVVLLENGNLVEENSSGGKRILRPVEKISKRVPKHFKLH